MTKTESTQTTKSINPVFVKNLLNGFYILACFGLAYKLGNLVYDRKIQTDIAKREASCPALFSIANTARDTLIVMKSEELCTEFVLNNVK
jgi:hypothetical protein